MAATPTAAPKAAPKAAPAPAPQAPPPTATSIYQALLAASANFGSLAKQAENPYYKSKYLALPDLLAAVRAPLADSGIVITSGFKLVTGGFVVETKLHHIPTGEQISSQFPVVDCSPQKAGAAGTFGMRYNLLQLLGIAPEDDDGNSAAGLTDPLGFAGPAPSGQQRSMPAQMPSNLQPGPGWLNPADSYGSDEPPY